MPIITKTCPVCSTSFEGPAFLMRKRTYCSHKCYSTNRVFELVGMRFGRLLVTEKAHGKTWKSICDCGNEAVSSSQNLRSGKAKSCGCLQREISALRKKTHGASNTRAHNSWSGMIQRCTNPKTKQYSDYGGRGITVCERWKLFENFLADMGQPPVGSSIERIDNLQCYSKENCKWADRSEQQGNRRQNLFVTHNGVTKCFTHWCKELGVHPSTGFNRIKLGKSPLEALGLI